MSDAKVGRFVRWAAILTGVYSVAVVVGVASHRFSDMVNDRGYPQMPIVHYIGHSISQWYPWILATPMVLLIYRRVPFTRARWPLAAVLHAATFVALFFLQNGLAVFIGHITGHQSPNVGFWQAASYQVVEVLVYDLFIYGGVLAVIIGLDYSKRYHDRDLRASQLETQLERARLEALQSQLQPHFLFNALNSVAMLVRRDRKQEALDVVVGFSELLRYVLDEAGTMDVELEEEVRFARRYLDIEQVRHRERLTVDIAVEPGVAHALVPNLVLQPLVENALKHGIARLPEGGTIAIRCTRRGANVHIEVENDGPQLPSAFTVAAATGLGVRNLRERLAAFFGADAQFTLANTPSGRSVLAVVELPFREQSRTALERAG